MSTHRDPVLLPQVLKPSPSPSPSPRRTLLLNQMRLTAIAQLVLHLKSLAAVIVALISTVQERRQSCLKSKVYVEFPSSFHMYSVTVCTVHNYTLYYFLHPQLRKKTRRRPTGLMLTQITKFVSCIFLNNFSSQAKNKIIEDIMVPCVRHSLSFSFLSLP